MEIGDENLPPSVNSVTKTESLVYAMPRSPGAVRSVLVAVNTSVNEAKSINDLGSGATEEEKCEAVAADVDAEAWSERTAVITRYDHETHCNLARDFIADLADKVVEESWKQPDQTKENSNSLHLKKQKLFLPDLVPSVATSRPLTDTVSESDEYESADEQPQLQNTLYLDSTVNPSTTFDASTPIDTPGWHLDFDSSRVAPVGDVTVDASLKDYSLPSVDTAPESLSQEPPALREETDGLGAIANFPARSSQPFSPSSGSDVDVSVVDSEADTLAAVTPNNPTNEVDVDLINQFERLVLSKQVLSKHSPATPTLNTTFPLNDEDENTPIVAVNQTVSSVNEEKDNSILPANVTQDILSTTRDLSAVNPDDSEFTSLVDQSEQSSFADLKGPQKTKNLVSDQQIVEKQTTQITEGEEAASDTREGHPVVEEEIDPVPEEAKAPVGEEAVVQSDIEEASSVAVEPSVGVVVETVPVVEEESICKEESAIIVQKEPVSLTDKELVSVAEEESVLVVKENPVPVVEEEPVPVVQEKPVPVVEEGPVPVVQEEPVPVAKEEPVPVVEEVPVTVVEEEPFPVLEEEPVPVLEEEPVPVLEEEPVPVLEEEPVPVLEEEPVPVLEEEPVPVLEEEPVPVLEEEPVPVLEEEPVPVLEEEPVPVLEEEPVPVLEEEPVPVLEEELVPVLEEELVPVVEEVPISVVEEAPAPVLEVEPAPVIEKESVSVVKEELLSAGEEKSVPAEEEKAIPETEKEIVPVIAEETVSVASVLEQESVAATEESISSAERDLEQIIGNKTTLVHEEQNVVGEEQSIIKERAPAIGSQPASSIENSDAVEPVDVNNSDTGLAEGDSSFSSAAEQTVLNAADKSSSIEGSEIPSEDIQPSSAVENSEFTSSQDPDTSVAKPTSLPEEKPIVPKKGYDLSFLDRFDDLENATPSISQAKLLPQLSTPITDYSASPVTEQHFKTVEIDKDQEVEVAQTIDTTSNVESEKENFVPVNSQESQPTEVSTHKEPVLEDKAADVSVHTNPEQERVEEEPLIVPKKGYDLSFLDNLEDLENAAPPIVGKGSQKPKMKENVSAKDNIAEPAEEQPSPDSKPEKPAGSSPTKKAPVVRKPIRPRIARPAATATKADAFEVEFAFDPNEDPFKPKKKLGASPTRDGSPQKQPEANICNTHQVDNSEDNNTVIESIPQSASPNPETVSERLSSEGTEQEEFRPAQEVFHDPSELDFLMQHGGSSHDIALARQSLFVKFDPLVTGRPSMFPSRPSDGGGDETILAEESTGRKSAGESLFLFSPPHASSAPKVEKADSVEKARPQECLMSSRNVTGDVLSLNEHKEALKLQELLFQDKLLQKEREILMKENEIHDFKSKFEATIEAQAQMRQIVGEYEKTISQLIAEKEREKANMETTLQNTIKERDQAIEDLKEVERAFSEFHRMYERNRTAAENLHKNEEALKKALAAYQERLQQEQHKYETLKLHAAQKLEGAQQEMENLKRNLEGESSRVKAQLKKTEMRLASVEQSLEQKSKENEELTTLCDELINKLGSNAK